MQLAREQLALIEHVLPVQPGYVRIDDLTLLNAIPYVAVNGCTWRGLPAGCGRWHTVCTRMGRWAKAGVLDGVFEPVGPPKENRVVRGRTMPICAGGATRASACSGASSASAVALARCCRET